MPQSSLLPRAGVSKRSKITSRAYPSVQSVMTRTEVAELREKVEEMKKRLREVSRINTKAGISRLWDKIEKRPDGDYYLGRKVIGRDTGINKGVYIGNGAREAIVVDRKYGAIDRLFEKAKQRATVNGVVDESRVPQAVFDTVKEAMPIQSREEVQKIIDEKKVGQEGKIALDIFIDRGVGVCRHDSLACAAVLEVFKEKGMIHGTPHVERNIDERGGHGWCTLELNGEKIVLDIPNNLLKKLKETTEEEWTY
ncbi:hypothetical protein H0N95_02270 [Candidatus Micrarchaeota archaeon]|nr:hypothetical protein [Candidatus Micrarchaeota archaeon]